MFKISKELMEEIVNEEINYLDTEPDDENLIEYDFECGDENEYVCINIYELAHKCKEWAFKKGFSFEIFNSDSHYYELSPKTYNEEIEEWEEYPYFTSSTEPEVVFKACEWILENTDELSS